MDQHDSDFRKTDLDDFSKHLKKGESLGTSMADLIIAGQNKTVPSVPVEPAKTKKRFIVAVDFDGTVVTHEYPKVGKDAPYAADVLRNLTHAGADIILFTMRSGRELIDAVHWFDDKGITLFGINENPEQYTWTKSPKPYANVYIDDAAVGCPLIHNLEMAHRPYVDWLKVEREVLKHPFFK